MLKQLMERISQYEKQIEQSAANHNALVGALAEAKSIYELAKTEADKALNDVIECVDNVVSEM